MDLSKYGIKKYEHYTEKKNDHTTKIPNTYNIYIYFFFWGGGEKETKRDRVRERGESERER